MRTVQGSPLNPPPSLALVNHLHHHHVASSDNGNGAVDGTTGDGGVTTASESFVLINFV